MRGTTDRRSLRHQEGSAATANFSGGDINIYGGELVASSSSNKYAIELKKDNATLTVYGGKMSASCPQGQAVSGYVKSGTDGIKFYFADTEGNWDGGTSYSDRHEASNKHYIKAE